MMHESNLRYEAEIILMNILKGNFQHRAIYIILLHH
jgi:hypothetical protein